MNNHQVAQRSQYTVKQLVKTDLVKEKFSDVLGKRAPQFTTSLINVVNSNYQLQNVDANSVIASALVAASLNLPINQNLGYMYIVPYGGKAQPQMGYKGYIQLAQRSGQYKKITAVPVYEDEFEGWNPLTEEIKYTPQFKDRDKNDEPVGYYARFELLNGFVKSVYWTRKQVDNHRKQFSKSGGNNEPKVVWASNFDAMALKTVIRNLLTKWGPMTVDMQTADNADSGQYDHLEDERRKVNGEEEQTGQAIIGDLMNQEGQNQELEQLKEVEQTDKKTAEPVKDGESNGNSNQEQEELPF